MPDYFSLAFWVLVDTAATSTHKTERSDHSDSTPKLGPTDWTPGIFSLLGFLTINLAAGGKELETDSDGRQSARKSRFLEDASLGACTLLVGGLVGSLTLSAIKYASGKNWY
ncbi:hypothetical protein L218DRAFT_947511 [Marasmius fiardii PR-910]|nr:hypothetical protein L218DRAFT_947511 [Marasmius fiardii PR-910]